MRDYETSLTQSRLKEVLRYESETGVFVWIQRRGRSAPGVTAGVVAIDSGYRTISVDCFIYRAHRLAWLYIHGQWPLWRLDHKNGVKDDNRIENLREATAQENARNTGMRSHNTSGYRGVCRNGSGWSARIGVGVRRKLKTLGNFRTPEEASAAYEAAAKEVHGDFYRPPNPPSSP